MLHATEACCNRLMKIYLLTVIQLLGLVVKETALAASGQSPVAKTSAASSDRKPQQSLAHKKSDMAASSKTGATASQTEFT